MRWAEGLQNDSEAFKSPSSPLYGPPVSLVVEKKKEAHFYPDNLVITVSLSTAVILSVFLPSLQQQNSGFLLKISLPLFSLGL